MTEQYSKSSINSPIGARDIRENTALNLDDNLVVVITDDSPVEVTMPPANTIPGHLITIKANDAGTSGNPVTIVPLSGENIDGSSSESLVADEEFLVLQSDGSNWRVVGRNTTAAPSTARDYKDFGLNFSVTGSRAFLETRGYFTRTFSFEPEVIMIAPSTGRLLKINLYANDTPGITEFSLFRPGISIPNPYATVQHDISSAGMSQIFDFSGLTTELLEGQRFSIGIQCAATAGIIAVTATLEWDL